MRTSPRRPRIMEPLAGLVLNRIRVALQPLYMFLQPVVLLLQGLNLFVQFTVFNAFLL